MAYSVLLLFAAACAVVVAGAVAGLVALTTGKI